MEQKPPKQPWKPSLEQLAGFAGSDIPTPENDPSLEQVIESMVKIGGSKHRSAREKRVYHRHLSPKAKARKKVRRRLRKNSRRENPSNRGKSQGGSK